MTYNEAKIHLDKTLENKKRLKVGKLKDDKGLPAGFKSRIKKSESQ